WARGTFWSSGTFHVRAWIERVFGLNALGTALVPRDGHIATSSPAANRLWTSVSTGRPVARSIWVAQLTLTIGCAAISLQLVRSSTYRKPFLFAWIMTFRSWPATRISASNCSSVASTSYTSLGVYW